MTIYFTADTHFGHQGILRMSKRPFTTIQEHDELLVEAWNSTVRPGDEVWHLGDFAYRCPLLHAETIFKRLNGTKRLVCGNHEQKGRKLGWTSQHEGYLDTVVAGRRIILCHYGMRAWPGAFRGALHLYGHTHGLLPDTLQSADVGVDRWPFRPVRLEEILGRMQATGLVPEEIALARAREAEEDVVAGEDEAE